MISSFSPTNAVTGELPEPRISERSMRIFKNWIELSLSERTQVLFIVSPNTHKNACKTGFMRKSLSDKLDSITTLNWF